MDRKCNLLYSSFFATLVVFFSVVGNSKGTSKSKGNLKTSISTSISRISNGITSQQANAGSSKISFSDNGRYVVFQSNASNLVANDNNSVSDIFLYDSQTSSISRISMGVGSVEANGASYDPVISGDGNYVAFVSNASNLVSSDTNNKPDIFRVSLSTGAITRVSVSGAGAQADGASGEPSISYDGNLITFTSMATNLVSSDSNGVKDIFLRNVSAGTTVIASKNISGVYGNKDSNQSKISSDGSSIVFTSDATNLVASDTNGCSDIFIFNISTGAVQIVSASSSGQIGNRTSSSPDLSGNGNYVVFESRSNNLISSDNNGYVDVFMKNVSTGEVTLISHTSAGGQVKFDSVFPSISLDGRFVVFESRSQDFVSWDNNNLSDVFINDTSSGLVTPFSSLSGNVIGNSKSLGAKISGDGSKIGFGSLSTNLVTPDSNGQYDLFTRANPLVGNVVNATMISNLIENGVAQDAFLITRYGDNTQALTVYYTISGSATAGVDYQALAGSVVIPANSSSAIIQVTPLTDATVEPNESITLAISDNAAYEKGGKDTATVQILVNDEFTVNITAADNVASEDGADRGVFTISRTGGTLGDLTVNLSISGTATPGVDYISLPSFIVIPAGQTSVDLIVVGLEDQVGEGDESVIASIASGAGYHAGSSSQATVTIKDNDQNEVNIQAIDPTLSKIDIQDTGTFRISRITNGTQNLVVSYLLKGTAQNGVDYQTLSGSATIPAGSSYVDVTVTAIASATQQVNKTIAVELINGTTYFVGNAKTATLVIKEDSNLPIISIESIDSVATENGSDTGKIRVSRGGSTTSSLAVSLIIGGTAVNGADYVTISTPITIDAGQPYKDIIITGIEDTLVEPTETVIIALQGSSNYIIDDVNSQAQVNIYDNDTPTVQIFREGPSASESLNLKSKIRISRTGNLTNALVVNLTKSGSPVAGVDYVNPGSSITIPAGAESKTIEISAISDNVIEGNKKLILSIGSSADYLIGDSNFTEVNIIDGSYKIFQDVLGITPNADVMSVSISDSGRYMAFSSEATNLVAGDMNGVSDIFLIDTTLKTIRRVMVPGSIEPNGASRDPMISADSRFVVFSSKASNFYAEDTNWSEDVFLYELATENVTYISKGYTYLSLGGDSSKPYISSNGDYVVFESKATNLVPGDTNGVKDIFLYKRLLNSVERVNLKTGVVQFSYNSGRPTVSSDGNFIAFESEDFLTSQSDFYTSVMLVNRAANSIQIISYPVVGSSNNGKSSFAKISADGIRVFYQSESSNIVANDVNSVRDIFSYNVKTQANEIISSDSDGWSGNRASSLPSIDATGSFGLFISNSKNFNGTANCSTSAFVKSIPSKRISMIENAGLNNCYYPIKEAFISSSGDFVVSVISSAIGSREIVISSNPLK